MSLRALKQGLLVLALLSACNAFGPKGPTEVARGEYYSAGRPEYDSFFIVLYEKQVQLLSAPQDSKDARAELTQALALTPDASDDSLKERLGQELKKLQNQGLRLRLDVPEPSQTLDASATLFASETTTSSPLRDTLPHVATRLVRSRNRMLATKAELEKLRVMGITLEGSVEQAFRTQGPWKRDEVRKNLGDGQKVITLMQSRAQDVADQDAKLLALLGTTATTDPNVGKQTEPPVPEEGPKPNRRTGRGNGRAAAPAAPRPTTPTPAPAKPSRGGDEDAARPKPTQGSAPAEIEP